MSRFTVQSLRCPHCLAPLDWSGAPIVKCRYCGTQTRVVSQGVRASAPAPTPSDGLPLAKLETKLRPSAIALLVAVLLVPITVSLVGAMVSSGGSLGWTWITSEPCEVDAGGQRVVIAQGNLARGEPLSIIGFAATTGDKLWDTESPKVRRISCAADGVLLEHDKGFVVELIDGAGRRRFKRKLSDRVDQVASRHGCVRITTVDNETLAFGLEGTPTDCSDARVRLPRGGLSPVPVPSPPPSLQGEEPSLPPTFVIGDVGIRHQSMGKGTKRLGLTGSRDGETAWVRTLELEDASYRLAAAADGVLAAGNPPGDDSRVQYAFVDAKTGAVRYQHFYPSATDGSTEVSALHLGAAVGYLKIDGQLFAFDLRTGNKLWTAGETYD